MPSNHPAIAVAGLACVFPDANTPGELWENVLAQRRAFRRLPPVRLRAEDYYSADPAAPDCTYAVQGAVIANYEFDRVAFRVVGSTFRSADLAHWLALDVAARALADAGFPERQSLPRETTGVVLGNTLTGEFSRANILRLRWPYVRRVTEAALEREGWTKESRQAFLQRLEAEYKSPFPAVGEETLPGGLSNTIAGRICNHFDLNGGGYTVDGACASSLLAVTQACAALAAGDLDVALAGGVDLSLDPFELVGFAKAGALAAEEMRVFDRRSAGFWPGEGCGFVVLMRHEDALAQGCRVYAVIRGWGVSSDGSGGLTRPEARGQLEALRRAYRRAGFGSDTVGYFEAHGTGTAVGDATELEVLSQARREAGSNGTVAAIGSIKANIGHTKAAAGLAGLIKATMAVHAQVLPPTTGCEYPHPLLGRADAVLRPLREAENWPADHPLRAGVSAMGFGGINTHVALEGLATERRRYLPRRACRLSQSQQDCELFLFADDSLPALARQVEKLLAVANGLSCSEMSDLAAALQKQLPSPASSKAGETTGAIPMRAAVVASKPSELSERLQVLRSWLEEPMPGRFRFSAGVFLGASMARPRIALLFPGQGSPTHLDGGIWRRRFDSVRQIYAMAGLALSEDTVSTRVVQPAVVTASLAGLSVLQEFGLSAEVVAAIGHSLGELTALHWAGALSAETLLQVARVRGAAMAELGSPTGAMLAIAAPAVRVREMLDTMAGPVAQAQPALTDNSDPTAADDSARTPSLAIVGFNSPRQTVVAGEAVAIEALARLARASGCQATLLPVSHAFHTPLVARAVPVLRQHLTEEKFAPLERTVISTITGALLDSGEDLRALLCRQVTSPVKFENAFLELLSGRHGLVDLLLEVGPGEVLTGLVGESTRDVPALAMDAGGPSLKGLMQALGAAFALGAPVRHEALFANRFTRPFALDTSPKFFTNPCELAPVSADGVEPRAEPQEPRPRVVQPDTPNRPDATEVPPLELIRQLVASRAELPVVAVKDESRMLSDLHLNSITVGQLVSEAARRLGLPRVVSLTDFANATVADTARALEELRRTGGVAVANEQPRLPEGVDTWVETFTVDLVDTPIPARAHSQKADMPEASRAPGGWRVFAPKDHRLAKPLQAKLAELAGQGVLLCLPECPAEDHVELLLEAGRAALAMKGHGRFVLVQHGWGASGFARTLHLETPGLTTCVVNVPPAHPRAVDWIVAEVRSGMGYTEAHYDRMGRRCEPRLNWLSRNGALPVTSTRTARAKKDRASSTSRRPAFPVGPKDVLLVTGGGKGIAAECALALGRATGVRLVLLGRALPNTDKELAENLARIAAAGVPCCYVRADVADAAAVRAAISEAEQKLGRITALLHGAGTNTPQLVAALDSAAFHRTLAPKTQGLRNVLAALHPARLRLLVTFSSIIARTGLRGEADYATANEWLSALTEQFQTEHPKCCCLALEWSVWSGVGMGQRLGRVEALVEQGITPIPVEEGVRVFLELLQRRLPKVSVVVTGRFGEPPALKMPQAELPLKRFLERPRVHYPGIELIVDTELSTTADPYLDDHVLEKQKLFPAVFGLEAMAQAAMALVGTDQPPSFEKVQLTRPIVVSDQAPTMLRLAALRRGADLVEVCLRSEHTDFQVDHFRALCRFENDAWRVMSDKVAAGGHSLAPATRLPPRLLLDPSQDLYGRLLFHKNRFCRVRNYRILTARECVAELAPPMPAPWFGRYLPADLVLGDPGARDAALHAIQACIPHQRILPTGIDRLVIRPPSLRAGRSTSSGARFVRATERFRDGKELVYDLQVINEHGDLMELWEGLHLRIVEELAPTSPWPEALLGPYLERRLEELVADSHARVALRRDRARNGPLSLKQRRQTTDKLLQRAIGAASRIGRRPDGKPEVLATPAPARRRTNNGNGRPAGRGSGAEADHSASLAVAHAQDLTLVVTDGANAACDVEPVVNRSEQVWRDLLGEERFGLADRIGRERHETTDAAAARLWAAAECLKKAGLAPQAPLVLQTETADGWVVLRSGAMAIATCVLMVQKVDPSLAVAVALHES